MNCGFIKLPKSFLQWEWYRDIPTKVLALHLLLSCNHERKVWKGIALEPGQIATGRKKLAEETGLSEQQIRRSLDNLQNNQFLTIKTTNKYSIITICNSETYQGRKKAVNQQTNQETTSKTTTTKEYKNIINNITPIIPEKNDDVAASWRDDFDIYRAELKNAYIEAIHNLKWIDQRQIYHPTLDICLTLQKSIVDFWGTEAGWIKKKKTKSKKINWLATFNTTLSISSNQVRKPYQSTQPPQTAEKAY